MHKADNLNIILIGFMATGKTSVGEKLAEKLDRTFIDTDRLIEQKTGLKTRQIFEKFGEPYFRMRESEAVAQLSSYPAGSLVVATGGGVLLREENRVFLKNNGFLILLTADQKTILSRSGNKGERPLLNGQDPVEKIRSLLGEREILYSDCDLRIDTTGKTIIQVVREIVEKIES